MRTRPSITANGRKLYELVGAYQMLADADAQDDEGLAAALAQLFDAIEQKADSLAARTLELEAAAIEEEAKRLHQRAAVRRNRVDSLKVYLVDQLAAAGKTNVQGKLCTVAFRERSVLLRYSRRG